MSRKKTMTTVYLEPEQDVRIKALSAATRIPVATYMREGVDLVLRLYEAKL